VRAWLFAPLRAPRFIGMFGVLRIAGDVQVIDAHAANVVQLFRGAISISRLVHPEEQAVLVCGLLCVPCKPRAKKPVNPLGCENYAAKLMCRFHEKVSLRKAVNTRWLVTY
jgi:hypothetical protein